MKDQLSKDEERLFHLLENFHKKYGVLYTVHILMMWCDLIVKNKLLEENK